MNGPGGALSCRLNPVKAHDGHEAVHASVPSPSEGVNPPSRPATFDVDAYLGGSSPAPAVPVESTGLDVDYVPVDEGDHQSTGDEGAVVTVSSIEPGPSSGPSLDGLDVSVTGDLASGEPSPSGDFSSPYADEHSVEAPSGQDASAEGEAALPDSEARLNAESRPGADLSASDEPLAPSPATFGVPQLEHYLAAVGDGDDLGDDDDSVEAESSEPASEESEPESDDSTQALASSSGSGRVPKYFRG